MANDDTTNTADPTTMITAIGDVVDDAVDTITGKVDGVREWANRTPCDRQQFLYEESLTTRPLVRRVEGSLAWLQNAGPNAIQASILAQGRDTQLDPPRYTGGHRLAAWLEAGPLPVPPAAVLVGLLGGPFGGGAAKDLWINWIEDRLPPGRPSRSNSGVMLGRPDVRLKNGVLQGEAVQASYDDWVQSQYLNVQPWGVWDWSSRVARISAKVASLQQKERDLMAELARMEIACQESRDLADEREGESHRERIRTSQGKQALIALAIVAAAYAASQEL